jgi:hypothetical protein
MAVEWIAGEKQRIDLDHADRKSQLFDVRAKPTKFGVIFNGTEKMDVNLIGIIMVRQRPQHRCQVWQIGGVAAAGKMAAPGGCVHGGGWRWISSVHSRASRWGQCPILIISCMDTGNLIACRHSDLLSPGPGLAGVEEAWFVAPPVFDERP